MAKCFSSSTTHCLGQTQTSVAVVGIYIWLGKSHPIITSVSRLNTAREHSQALEWNHVYSSVLEWCLELFWLETTNTLPMHSWQRLRIQHQPGAIPRVGLDAATLFQRQGYFMAIDTDRLCQLHLEIETGPWHCLVCQGSQTHSSTPITTVTGSIQWFTKLCADVQSWWNIYSPNGSEPFQYHSMGTVWQRQEQDHIPCRQLSNASCSATTVTLGLAWFFDCSFSCLCSRVFVCCVFALFIFLLFVSFCVVLYFLFWFVDLATFFKCCITL